MAVADTQGGWPTARVGASALPAGRRRTCRAEGDSRRGLHDPAGDCGVNSMVFRARRPFHWRRLHDTLEDLADESLRARGQLWIASQPDTVIGLESAGGGIDLGGLGHWLAALPVDRWTEASDCRRIAPDLDWDPYYGDRRACATRPGQGRGCGRRRMARRAYLCG